MWDQGIWIKLSILSPITSVPPWTYCPKLGFLQPWNRKLSNPPAGFEAKIDTDHVQTLCDLYKTTNVKEALPGNHWLIQAWRPWPPRSGTSTAHPNEVQPLHHPKEISNIPEVLGLQPSSPHPSIVSSRISLTRSPRCALAPPHPWLTPSWARAGCSKCKADQVIQKDTQLEGWSHHKPNVGKPWEERSEGEH